MGDVKLASFCKTYRYRPFEPAVLRGLRPAAPPGLFCLLQPFALAQCGKADAWPVRWRADEFNASGLQCRFHFKQG
jgi:hypothetical protein